MTILYYDCFAGISGDMNLGAMVDLGVPSDHLQAELAKLNLEGYSLKISKGQKNGISGTKVSVLLKPGKPSHGHSVHDHIHRGFSDIKNLIEKSDLDNEIKDYSIRIFKKLAEAESKIHNKTIDEIHFHEVGAVDSIVDIVGAAICLHYLKPDKIMASSVEVGGGFVKCEHGTFPVPAPATAELLAGTPVKSGAVDAETTTPTGAAILTAFVDEFTDNYQFQIQKTAYGLGTKEFDIPNVLRVFLANEGEKILDPAEIHKATILECNIDDMNPEIYGYVMELLFENGAHDVFITPIIMKKSRPGSKLSVLCSSDHEEQLTDLLLLHTTSLGIRKYEVDKILLKRESYRLKTKYGEVTIKTAIYKGKKLKSKPEYEECVRIAREYGIPVHQVYQEINSLLEKI
jgi:uncharacterized protein (TIGR00299 family) protein